MMLAKNIISMQHYYRIIIRLERAWLIRDLQKRYLRCNCVHVALFFAYQGEAGIGTVCV